jgi:DNA-binding response OmpR family regulator
MNLPVILMVDDDGVHIDRTVSHLRRLKITVLLARTNEEALRMLARHDVDLVLLELGLGSEIDPEAELVRDPARLPALEILEIVRSEPCYIPVIVVTYLYKPIYELIATRSGADAFLRKTVDLTLLAGHVRNKLDIASQVRSHSPSSMNCNGAIKEHGRSILTAGELLIDIQHRLVRVGDAAYQGLSEKEVKLLSLLAGNPGTVFGRRELLEKVWGAEAGESYDAVDAAVKRIRKKIEPSLRHPRYLIAVRGLGYCLAE